MWNWKSSVALACFLPRRAKDLSAPLYVKKSEDACVMYLLQRAHISLDPVMLDLNAFARLQRCCKLLQVKFPLFLSHFNEPWTFLTDFRKKSINFMKIRPMGAELFHSDGRTDMTMLIVVVRNLPNAPKNRRFESTKHVNA